jgi:hypothetical protein
MRHSYIGSFALILLLACASNSFADGIAISNATLDWTGFTFTVTSGLTVSVVDATDFDLSFASTTLGGSSQEIKNGSPPKQHVGVFSILDRYSEWCRTGGDSQRLVHD